MAPLTTELYVRSADGLEYHIQIGRTIRRKKVMAGFIARQPNGKLCRFSTVMDCVTEYNMTDEEYIELCMERAREEAEETIKNYIMPFQMVVARTVTGPGANMSKKEWQRILREMTESGGQ